MAPIWLLLSWPLRQAAVIPVVGIGFAAAGAAYGSFDLSKRALAAVMPRPPAGRAAGGTNPVATAAAAAVAAAVVAAREVLAKPVIPRPPALPVDESVPLPVRLRNASVLAMFQVAHYPYRFRFATAFVAGSSAGVAWTLAAWLYNRAPEAAGSGKGRREGPMRSTGSATTGEALIASAEDAFGVRSAEDVEAALAGRAAERAVNDALEDARFQAHLSGTDSRADTGERAARGGARTSASAGAGGEGGGLFGRLRSLQPGGGAAGRSAVRVGAGSGSGDPYAEAGSHGDAYDGQGDAYGSGGGEGSGQGYDYADDPYARR